MIRQAIMQQLKEHYPNHHIYGETIKQDFKQPCFFVAQINTTQTKGLRNRYFRTYSFDIHYFNDDQGNADLLKVGEELAELMVLLEPIKLHGYNISYQIIDRVLHFLADYKVNLLDPQTDAKMGDLILNEGVIEDGK